MPMTNTFLTIKQAAKLTGKSEVTIRRLIKRLLKNRTATTDKMITMTNRHGSSVYKINRTFLIEHANLPDEIRDQLLSATTQVPGQTDAPNYSGHAVHSQTTPVTSGLDSSSEQVDYPIDAMPSRPCAQPTSQPNRSEQANGNPLSNDRPTKPIHPNQSPTQVAGHFSGDGLNLLKKTIDHLSTQLEKKDVQIAEKDKQLKSLDKHLIDEKDQVKKLTQIIQQGNLLVHSAQQRIPLPDEDKMGELIESAIVADEITEQPKFESETEALESDLEQSEKRGVFSKILGQFGRSNN